MRETEQLVTWVDQLTYADLPEPVVDMAKACIRDAVGVGLFASSLEWTQMVAAMAREADCAPVASVWGCDWKTSAPYAAMINGTGVHGIEMDDRSHNLEIHNGAATVPAALALAEKSGKSGQDLIVAVVCGFEVAFRLARATQARIENFYWSSVRSVFGSAAASGKVIGLDHKGLLNTLGITGSLASGLHEHVHDPRGTMVKRLQGGGWPAQSGATAALLAEKGMTAPSTILEGKLGVCQSFCTKGEPDIQALVRGLGEGFEIEHWETKPYATWGSAAGILDALSQAREEAGVSPDEVTRISVGCSNKSMTNARRPWPQSVLSAQANMPFVVAASFYYDMGDPGIWSEEILSDERIPRLAERFETFIDDELERQAAETNVIGAGKVALTLADGRTIKAWVPHPSGTPENPLTEEQLTRKFRTLSSRALPDAQIDELLRYINTLDTHTGQLDLAASRT